jgi:IS1 family transposase
MGMNKTSRDRRIQILTALVEGNSIASTCRMVGVAKNTVLRLLADAGFACFDFQDAELRGLTARRVQCDEIWAFVHAKAKNVPAERKGEFGIGDVWTWTAIDADSKLMISWMVGGRDGGTAATFMDDVASRLAGRVQLTTDGHKPYLMAVEGAFGADIDYAQLIKIYGEDPNPDKRYSPAVCTGAEKRPVMGSPDERHISTSYVERANLSIRMASRRFTRLTNAFSKKVENLEHSVSLYFMYYNYCRPHMSLKGITPAMASGLTDRVWTLGDIVDLIDEAADPIIG